MTPLFVWIIDTKIIAPYEYRLKCQNFSTVAYLTPTTTNFKEQFVHYKHTELSLKAADDKICDIFPDFRRNKAWYFMRNVCQQTILMKHHALFSIFEKAANL